MTTKKLETKSKPNIFLFHGEDDYTTAKKVHLWIDAFSKKHGAQGVSVVNCTDSPDWLKQWQQVGGHGGLFSRTQLIILKNAFSLPADDMEPITEKLDEVSPDDFILFWQNTAAKKILRLYKKIASLEKAGRARIDFHTVPTGPNLTRFMQKYAADNDLKISPAALEKLAQNLGRDLSERVKTAGGYDVKVPYTLWQVVSELDKLKAYKNNGQVLPEDVEVLVAPKVSDNIFLFTNAVSQKSKNTARKYLNQLFEASVSGTAADPKAKVLPIIGALASQFRSLLLLAAAQEKTSSSYELAQVLGWSPYRVNINSQILRNFSQKELKSWMSELLGIDKKIKSSAMPPKVLLSAMINKLI